MERSMTTATWKRALQRCLSSQSHALIDASVVLIYVDTHRVFHPAQALVQITPQAGGDDEDSTYAPLIVVMRLHPQLTALLPKLTSHSGGELTEEDLDAILESLLFQEQSAQTTSNISSDDGDSPTGASFFAAKRVNLDGGALRLYGATPQSASQALSMVTLAIASRGTGGENLIKADFDRFTVLVEHADGYVGREYVVQKDSATTSTSTSTPSSTGAAPPRLFKIQRREWSSSAVAQLSLDDALEAFEAAYLEEQEINRNGADAIQPSSLHIDVNAAFEVRDQSRRAHGSAFLMDGDYDVQPANSGGMALPPMVLFSQWGGLENVRALLCKPPPQSASTLCFSCDREPMGAARGGPRQSLVLLRHLEAAIQDQSSSHRTWQSADSDMAPTEIFQKLQRFLKTIDEDESQATCGDDNTNNTIESTISMALDGEREFSQAGATRAGMDPIEKLWDFLTKYANGSDMLLQIMQEFIVFLSNTRIFPAAHPENGTQLAKLMRARVDEIQSTDALSAPSFTSSAHQLLAQPLKMLACMIEAGEWKMKRDVAFWLAQTGFSSQECDEFVQAMPRFDVHSRNATSVHWKAMDHVLQLCSAGRSIHLPVAFMRKAVHNCVAFYARGGGQGTSEFVDPSILVDLQSFIPDRLRSNIADALYWDLRIAFDADYEHRVRICQDSFHPIAKSNSSSDKLVLNDATLCTLHRKTPERLMLHSEMIQFTTKLEDEREKRLYEQLHDIDMPAGLTRYDCTIRQLHCFS